MKFSIQIIVLATLTLLVSCQKEELASLQPDAPQIEITEAADDRAAPSGPVKLAIAAQTDFYEPDNNDQKGAPEVFNANTTTSFLQANDLDWWKWLVPGTAGVPTKLKFQIGAGGSKPLKLMLDLPTGQHLEKTIYPLANSPKTIEITGLQANTYIYLKVWQPVEQEAYKSYWFSFTQVQ